MGYVDRLCGACEAGYTKDGGVACVRCVEPAVNVVLVAGDAVIYLMLVVGAWFLSDTSLNAVVYALQCLQMIRVVGRRNAALLPPWLATVYDILQLTTGEPISQQGCFGDDTGHFSSEFYSYVGLVGVVILAFVVGMPVYARARAACTSSADKRTAIRKRYAARRTRGLVVFGVFSFTQVWWWLGAWG